MIFSTVTLVVYNQVQLTELTDQINTTTQQLEEAESLEVQLNMEASQQMNGSQVEEYATQELGMKKVVSDQVTYVNVAEEDQALWCARPAGAPSWISCGLPWSPGLPDRAAIPHGDAPCDIYMGF